jgi:dTDP-glucose pyrophosphorylase
VGKLKDYIVVTMAGDSGRFFREGYTKPKYEISVKNKSLFAWSVESLSAFYNSNCHLIFIGRKDFSPQKFIEKECKTLGIKNFEVLLLDSITNGQATTALAAEPALSSKDARLFIYNIDTHVTPNVLTPDMQKTNGWIPCFHAEGDSWSFVRADENNRVIEVREKKRISSLATIGLYGFSSFSIFAEAYRNFYSDKSKLEKGECYVAPLYNYLISQNHSVSYSLVVRENVIVLGTPDQVNRFISNET